MYKPPPCANTMFEKINGQNFFTLCKFLGVTELCKQQHSYFEKYEMQNYDCNTYCWQLFRGGRAGRFMINPNPSACQ